MSLTWLFKLKSVLVQVIAFATKNFKNAVIVILTGLCLFLFMQSRCKDRTIADLQEQNFELKPPTTFTIDDLDYTFFPSSPSPDGVADTLLLVTPELVRDKDSLVVDTGEREFKVDGFTVKLRTKTTIPLSSDHRPLVTHDIKIKQTGFSGRGWHTSILLGSGISWDRKSALCVGGMVGYGRYSIGVLASNNAGYVMIGVGL